MINMMKSATIPKTMAAIPSSYLSKEDDKHNDEKHHNPQNLRCQCTISLQILQRIRQCCHAQVHISIGIFDIILHPLHHIPMLSYHHRQLVEDRSQLDNIRFYLGHSVCSLTKVVLIGDELKLTMLPRFRFHVLDFR